MYALLFRDADLSPGQLSTLFVIWSATGFVFEVPSGAWADLVDRRRLLIGGAAIRVAAFAVWTMVPTFAGFAAGFVLWGLSSTIDSGTFEALLYDELSAMARTDHYARIVGWCHSASVGASLVAIAAAAPLMRWGGYTLVGWVSAGASAAHVLAARGLPAVPRAGPIEDGNEAGPAPDVAHRAHGARSEWVWRRYGALLRDGVREAARHAAVRGAVVVSALVVGLSAYDEYLPLVAVDHGVAAATVPLVIALIGGAQMIGTALAGRTSAMTGRTMAGLVSTAAIAVSVGAWSGGSAGFALIAVGYGALNNAMVVSEARLQSVITGRARATVTSMSGLAVEIVALSTYGYFALGAAFAGTVTLVALLGLPTIGAAVAAARLLPAEPGARCERRVRKTVRAAHTSGDQRAALTDSGCGGPRR